MKDTIGRPGSLNPILDLRIQVMQKWFSMTSGGCQMASWRAWRMLLVAPGSHTAMHDLRHTTGGSHIRQSARYTRTEL